MKCYKAQYEEGTRQFKVSECEVEGDTVPKNNHNDTVLYFKNEAQAQKVADKINKAVAEDKANVVKCKTCGKFFLVDEREKEWMQSQGFEMPKNCLTCRRKKRTEKNNTNKQ